MGYKALLFLTLVPSTGPYPDPSPAGMWPLPGKCMELSWSPLSCLAPGWDCGTDPDPREPLAAPSALTWSFLWPLLSSFILGSILLFHSVKPLFTSPKVSFTLVGVFVFSQLLQKFVFLWSDLRHMPQMCSCSLHYNVHKAFGFPDFFFKAPLPSLYLVFRSLPAPIITFHNLLYLE